jgi:hypothetical protein
MIFEKYWEFSDAQVGVNGTTAVATNIVDWTTSEYDEWVNTAVPLWIVVTVNTVGAGTSVQVIVYQHTATSLASGTALLSGRTLALADASANPRDPGHYLLVVPVMSCLASLQVADVTRYFGIVYSCTGDCTGWCFDAYVLASAQPPIPTVQVNSSNI